MAARNFRAIPRSADCSWSAECCPKNLQANSKLNCAALSRDFPLAIRISVRRCADSARVQRTKFLPMHRSCDSSAMRFGKLSVPRPQRNSSEWRRGPIRLSSRKPVSRESSSDLAAEDSMEKRSTWSWIPWFNAARFCSKQSDPPAATRPSWAISKSVRCVQIGNVFSPLKSIQLLTLTAHVCNQQHLRRLRVFAAGLPNALLPPTIGLAQFRFQLRATRGCERERVEHKIERAPRWGPGARLFDDRNACGGSDRYGDRGNRDHSKPASSDADSCKYSERPGAGHLATSAGNGDFRPSFDQSGIPGEPCWKSCRVLRESDPTWRRSWSGHRN